MRQQGFTLLELLIVIALIAVLAALAAPYLIEAHLRRNEIAAIASLRQLASAQTLFAMRDLDGDGIQNFAPDLTTLANLELIDETMVEGVRRGYIFTYEVEEEHRARWHCIAEPEHDYAGSRHFFIDESGAIRFAIDEPATADSPRISG